MNAERPTYIFAGGGTGGHLTPALAVAERLAELQPRAKVLFACTDRPIDARVLGPTGHGMLVQTVRPLPRSPRGWPGFLLNWRRSLRLARTLIRDVQPAAVLGLGGFAAGPITKVAAAHGIPTALLNPDAGPGKANVYLARRVDAVFAQFASTAGCFAPVVRTKIRAVGCPVRASVLGGHRVAAAEAFDLNAGKRTLLVTGGSLGAELVNQAVLGNLDLLAARADRWQLLHIAGPGKADEVRRACADSGVSAAVLEFCDRMGLAFALADLAVARGGANTIAELTATGTPGLILPYPFHRDRQQQLNAAEMVHAAAAEIIDDVKDGQINARNLRGPLERLLDDDEALAAMARSAGQLGKPDAAETVARWLMGQ